MTRLYYSFVSYIKYVGLDTLKLSKKCAHVVIQHILKHHNISLKKKKYSLF